MRRWGWCRVIAAVAALAAPAGGACAAEGGGDAFYLRVFGGYSLIDKPKIQGTNISNGSTSAGIGRGEMDVSGGPMGGGAVGYAWGVLRLEAMGSYETHDPTSFRSPQFTYRDTAGAVRTDLNATPTLDGSLRIFSGFANAVVDADFGAPIVPYAGAGVGFAHVKLDNVRGISNANSFLLSDDSDLVLAFQVIAGVAWRVTPSFSIELGYRFLSLNDPRFNDGSGGDFELGIDSHQVNLGIRFNF